MEIFTGPAKFATQILRLLLYIEPWAAAGSPFVFIGSRYGTVHPALRGYVCAL